MWACINYILSAMNHNKSILQPIECKLITMPQEPLKGVALDVPKATTSLIYISLKSGPELENMAKPSSAAWSRTGKSKSNMDYNRHFSPRTQDWMSRCMRVVTQWGLSHWRRIEISGKIDGTGLTWLKREDKKKQVIKGYANWALQTPIFNFPVLMKKENVWLY